MLKDTEGFKSQELDAVRYDLRAIKDEAPKVAIDEPANDRDVTPNADVPIEITADDDFGLASIRLVYTRSADDSEPEPGTEVVVPLWAAPVAAEGAPAASPVKRQAIKHVWKLEPLNLPIGTLLTFHAESRDRDDLRGPNVGKSRELHLRIVAPEQLANQIEGQRRDIREAIDRALTMQKQAIPPVRDAVQALDKGSQLDQARRDELKNAEPVQQQVSDRISNKNDGLAAMIRRHLDDLANLKIDNPDARAQMEEMLAGVEKIQSENLDPAAQELGRAAKSLDGKRDQEPPSGTDTPSGKADPAAATEKNAESKAGQPKSKSGQAKKSDDSGSGESKKADGEQPQPGDDAAEAPEANAPEKSAASKSGQPKSKSGQPKSGQSKSGESKKADGEAQPGDEANPDGADQPQPGDEANPDQAGKPKAGDEAKPNPSAKPQAGPKSPLKESLEIAAKNQKAIADELEKMRDSLGEFETFRGVVQDAKDLLKQHEEAMKAASELARKTEMADKPTDALTPEQKADLATAVDRQAEAAKNLAAVENKMDDLAQRLAQNDPASAAALKDAAQQSRERGTSGKMDKAAEGLKQNQMGQAQADQKQAQQDLKKLLDNLQNRRENELARLVKDLKDAEKDVKGLQERQRKNREQTAQAKANPDEQARREQLQKLSKEQKQIEADLKKTLLKLQKSRAQFAAAAAEQAAQKMAKAGQEQEDGDADDAEQMQEEALAGLDEVQDEIEEAIQDAEEQLAMEQLSKIKDHLQALAERQAKMAGETADYDKVKTAKGLTLGQRSGVRALGRVQDALKDDAADLKERLDAAPAFALQLDKAADKMSEAAEALRLLETGPEAQKPEEYAAKRIKQLLEALNPDTGENGAGGQQPGGPPPGGGQPGGNRNRGGDGIGLAAQLKILKILQIEINDRTEAIDEIKTRKKTLTPKQQAELDGLAEDQRKIADLARDLTKPKKSDGEQ